MNEHRTENTENIFTKYPEDIKNILKSTIELLYISWIIRERLQLIVFDFCRIKLGNYNDITQRTPLIVNIKKTYN